MKKGLQKRLSLVLAAVMMVGPLQGLLPMTAYAESKIVGEASQETKTELVSPESTPAPSEEPAENEGTPAPSEEPAEGESTPAPSEEPAENESTPAPSEEPAEGESTPAPSEEPAESESTPAPSEEPAESESTPAPSEEPELLQEDSSEKLQLLAEEPLTVYLIEDFSKYKKKGQAPAGFEMTGASDIKAECGPLEDAKNGKAVNLLIQENKSGAPDVGIAKRFGQDDITGQFIVDFDVKKPDKNGSLFIEIKDLLGKGISLGSIQNDGKLVIGSRKFALTDGEWNRVSFAISWNGADVMETVYLNGVEQIKDVKVKNSGAAQGLNYFRLRAKRLNPEALTAGADGTKNFSTLIDNLRIYSGTELKTMEELENSSKPSSSLMDVNNDLGISVANRLDKSVTMVVGNEYALVRNHREKLFESANVPIKAGGQILIPLKSVAAQFGMNVEISGNTVTVNGKTEQILDAVPTPNDILVPLDAAGKLLNKNTYTDYKGRGLIVIGDNEKPFDDSKDKSDESIKPQDNEKFFIEEAIKQVVYQRPTGAQVLNDLKTANHAHPRVLVSAADFERVKGYIQQGEPTITAWYQNILKEGKKNLERPLPTDDLPDGRRMISSRQVGPLVVNLSLLYHLSDNEADKAQYKERIWKEVETVMGFEDWNSANEFLNTAEFMEGLAIAYDWMYNEWTPEQRTMLEDAIIQKGLMKSLEAYNNNVWWIHTYPRANNWNAVCNGSTVLSVMALGDVERTITLSSGEQVTIGEFGAKLVDVALNALEDFILLEFAPDGAWSEGPSYWKYTLEYLVRFMSSLETATGQTYGYDRTPGLDKTAYFPNYLTGPVGSLNYGDASNNKINSPEVLWIARKYGDKRLNSIHLDDKIKNRFAGTEFEMLWYVPENYLPDQQLELDQYYSGTEVATFRGDWKNTGTSFLGLKAGNNVVSHGHYDLGSFVFEALGQQWAIDPGKDDYNLPGYFHYDKERLEYYRLNPQGHNTLLINPDIPNKYDRQQDIQAFAKIERVESKPQGGFAITDLTDAYNEKGAAKAKRGVMLASNRNRATIQDEIQFTSPSKMYWFMHTEAEVEIAPDGRSAVLTKGGEKLWVGLNSNIPEAKFTVLDAKPLPGMPNNPKQNQNIGMRKLTVELTDVTDVTLTVDMVPVMGGLENVKKEVKTVPLADWSIADGALITPVLSSLTVDGTAIAGFDPDLYRYTVELPLDQTTVPKVECSVDENLYTVEVVEAAEVPGTTKIIVSSKKDESIKSVYNVSFKLVPPEGIEDLLKELPIVAVNASAEQSDKGNVKENAIDNNYKTYWGAEGDQWIELDFGEPQSLNSVAIAFARGNQRAFKFDIETSLDGKEWYSAYSGVSSGKTQELEPVYVKQHEARYVRIQGHGNSVNQWNSYLEVKAYTLPKNPDEIVPQPTPDVPQPTPDVPQPTPDVPQPTPNVPDAGNTTPVVPNQPNQDTSNAQKPQAHKVTSADISDQNVLDDEKTEEEQLPEESAKPEEPKATEAPDAASESQSEQDAEQTAAPEKGSIKWIFIAIAAAALAVGGVVVFLLKRRNEEDR